MSRFELLIVRHADPDYANDSLTPRGRVEADRLAQLLRQVNPVGLFSSPMGRARETASHTAAATGLEVEVLDWAAELVDVCGLDGFDEPMAAWDLAGDWVHPGQDGARRWDLLPAATSQTIGEVVRQVREQGDLFLERFGLTRSGSGYRVEEDWLPGKRIVFCHGGFGLTWVSQLLDLPVENVWTSFYLAPSSVTCVSFERRTPEMAIPRVLRLGDLTHLRGLDIPENRRGLYGHDEDVLGPGFA